MLVWHSLQVNCEEFWLCGLVASENDQACAYLLVFEGLQLSSKHVEGVLVFSEGLLGLGLLLELVVLQLDALLFVFLLLALGGSQVGKLFLQEGHLALAGFHLLLSEGNVRSEVFVDHAANSCLEG